MFLEVHAVKMSVPRNRKEKKKTALFGVKSMRSQVLCRVAQECLGTAVEHAAH